MKKVFMYLVAGLVTMSCLHSCSDEEDSVKSSEKEITEFTINTVKGSIDRTAKTITFTLPAGTDVTTLTPTITVSGKATVSPKSGVTQNFTNVVTYTVTAEDGSTQVYTVSVNVEQSKDAKITAFSFGELTPVIVANIEEETKTISAIVPYGTTVTALVPTITISGGATITPASGVAQDFSAPISYKVTAANGDSVKYTVNVVIEARNSSNILSFVVNSVDASIDQPNKTITAVLPYGTSITALAPVIAVSEGASVSPVSGAVKDFTNPVEYTVTAENGAATSKYTATITTEPFATAITNVSPTTLKPGENITITGNFADSGNKVELTTTELAIVSQNATTIIATVPVTINEGVYSVSVTSNGAKVTYPGNVTVAIPEPVITSVTPLSAVLSASNVTVTVTGENFATSGNSISLTKGATVINVSSLLTDTETILSFTLPTTLTEGEYDITVNTGQKTVTYTSKFAVVDPNKQRIISLNSTEIQKGIDDLVVTGENLGEYAKIYFEKANGSSANQTIYPVNGTTVTYTASGFQQSFFTLGEYKVWLEVNNVETNKLTFNLIENANPVPTITSVSEWNPCRGDNVTVIGTNFGSDAAVKLETNIGMVQTPAIVSRTATTLVFSTDEVGESWQYVAVQVVSGGQKASKSGTFQTKLCTPEITGINPLSAAVGDIVTVTGKYLSGPTFKITIGDKFTYAQDGSSTEITFYIPYGTPQGASTLKITDYDGSTTYYETSFTVL
jgi:hypothetical protein